MGNTHLRWTNLSKYKITEKWDILEYLNLVSFFTLTAHGWKEWIYWNHQDKHWNIELKEKDKEDNEVLMGRTSQKRGWKKRLNEW